MTSLPSVQGTARVEAFPKRESDGKYWNGSIWESQTPAAFSVGFNRGNWGRTSGGLPSVSTSDAAKLLTPGSYIVTAIAYEAAGKRKSISHFFTVQFGGSQRAPARQSTGALVEPANFSTHQNAAPLIEGQSVVGFGFSHPLQLRFKALGAHSRNILHQLTRRNALHTSLCR